MVILPSDFTVIFLGNPYYLAEGNNENYRAVDSDIGYVRNLWGYGIIGTIIFLFPHLYIGRIAQKKMKQDKTAALLFVLFLEISFFHSKEQFMYVRMYFSIICIIFFLVTYDKFFQKKTENNNF